MRKWLLVLLLVTLTCALLVGCGPKAADPVDGTPADVSGPPVADGERPLRMTVSGNPYADPAVGSNWASASIYPNIYDPLITFEPDGDIISNIADSWEVSEDGLTYTFHLKKGILFHDGTEMNASDVAFTWKRLVTMDEGFSYLVEDTVKDCVAKDDYTVDFILNQTYGPFVYSLRQFYVVNEDLIMANLDMNHATYDYGEYGDFGRSFLLNNDAGSGPYYVTEVSQQNYLIAKQFADYSVPFGEFAPTYIQIINNTEATTVRTMLANGELEVSDCWQTAENLAAMDKLDGVDIVKYNCGAMQQLTINNSKEPTDDVNVRRAIACLMDYAAVVSSIMPDSVPAVGPVNAGAPGANTGPTIYPYAYDLERAKEYLAASKYADRLDEISIEFFATSGVTTQEKIGLLLQSAAAQIGLNITVTSAPYATQVERALSPETEANILTANQGSYYFEAGGVFDALYPKKSQGTTTNMSWIADDKMESMIRDSLAIVDDTERWAAYAELEKYINDQAMNVPICDVTVSVAYRSDYVVWPTAAYYESTGGFETNVIGGHFWFHDWEIHNENK